MPSSSSTPTLSPASSISTVKQSDSTGKTSAESKSPSRKDRSLEKKPSLAKWKSQPHIPQSSPEVTNCSLGTIEERPPEKEISPTIVTAERAAAAKIYLETYYNELITKPTQRDMRYGLLEGDLWRIGDTITPTEKNHLRDQFFHHETNHLRQTRAMKARTLRALSKGKGAPSSCCNEYQAVKALGKGSFGVVKLVREKPKPGDDPFNKKVYAMKVIRKSGMLRTCQEGHLRAERDFLVASEGSRW